MKVPCDNETTTTCYTSLQNTLCNVQADHCRMYPLHCELICDMLHSEPDMRPTCDDIITFINERCTDLQQRRDSQHMSQLTADMAATRLESQQGCDYRPFPAFCDMENSKCSDTTCVSNFTLSIITHQITIFTLRGLYYFACTFWDVR